MLGAVAAFLVLMSQSRPVPTPSQLAYHRMEMNAFVHFGPNTFSGKEWGDGRENPSSFNPTALDCRQWAKTFKKAGFKGVVLTAKHHDGFCLWPSKFSTHTVAASPFKQDVLKLLSDACKAEGLKLGVYLSPWDRNHPDYGTPKYNDVFVGMLDEVLTQYGPIFEVWFDGANGEGPNGKKQVYDWNRFISTVRKHQPNAVIFSDAGPDVRWVGNEEGVAPETCWATIQGDRYTPGTSLYRELGEGNPKGANWIPAECDVSIRPGWFWRESENNKVKTPEELLNLYYKSVGHGATFLLNVPPDRRGLIHENDVASLVSFGQKLKQEFSREESKHADLKVLNDRVGELDFGSVRTVDRVVLQENIEKGQRISQFELYAEIGKNWEKIASGTTIGYKKLVRFNAVSTQKLRLEIVKSIGAPDVSAFKAYRTPTAKTEYRFETKAQKDSRMAWWRDARFGMFIHWGLYSIPAGEWKGKNYSGASEWLISHAGIPIGDWMPLQKQFNPVNFDAKKIVATAKEAGMKYIVITSKHHEGFAIYPSKFGDWHIGNTQFKRDPLKELSEECRKQGIKFCTYHSILDWHHPDYLPRERWDKRPTEGADFERYVKHMKGQLKEIVERYSPEVMWFDGEWQKTWTHERGIDLYNFVRSLKPSIIINNRVDVGRNGMQGFSDSKFMGDFGTPEQEIPTGPAALDWESCMTMNDSWGFHAKDLRWKSAETLIDNLIDCASKGGNYLLNVGPTSLGEIPKESIDRLQSVGEWLQVNAEAIYGTQGALALSPRNPNKFTRKGRVLYMFVDHTDSGTVLAKGLKTGVKKATILGSKQTIKVDATESGTLLHVELPNQKVGPSVIKLELMGDPYFEEILPRQDATGAISLSADLAEFTGSVAYEKSKAALGFWTKPESTVSWEFGCSVPGTYKVYADLACADDTDGSLVSFNVDKTELQFVIPKTGGWDKFVRREIGTVTLSKVGKVSVHIKARMMPGYAVMNLKGLRLEP